MNYLLADIAGTRIKAGLFSGNEIIALLIIDTDNQDTFKNIIENLGIEKGKSIYQLFEEDHEKFLYVPKPQLKNDVWENYIP